MIKHGNCQNISCQATLAASLDANEHFNIWEMQVFLSNAPRLFTGADRKAACNGSGACLPFPSQN